MDGGTETIRLHKVTPLIQQYQKIKRGVGDAILLFRLGDFYEMFNEDAVVASKILGILLTRKSAGRGNTVPLAGVPAHSAESYIARLVKAGKKVAICEQTEDPSKAKGLVSRDVVRIVTAGTLVEENLLPPNVDNTLAAVSWSEDAVSLACVDISTGFLQVGEWPLSSDAFKNALSVLSLREFILPDVEPPPPVNGVVKDILVPTFRRAAPPTDSAVEFLNKNFGVGAVAASQIDRRVAVLAAIGLLRNYLAETRNDALPLCFP